MTPCRAHYDRKAMMQHDRFPCKGHHFCRHQAELFPSLAGALRRRSWVQGIRWEAPKDMSHASETTQSANASRVKGQSELVASRGGNLPCMAGQVEGERGFCAGSPRRCWSLRLSLRLGSLVKVSTMSCRTVISARSTKGCLSQTCSRPQDADVHSRTAVRIL